MLQFRNSSQESRSRFREINEITKGMLSADPIACLFTIFDFVCACQRCLFSVSCTCYHRSGLCPEVRERNEKANKTLKLIKENKNM